MKLSDPSSLKRFRDDLLKKTIPFFGIKEGVCFTTKNLSFIEVLHVMPGSYNPLHVGHKKLMGQIRKNHSGDEGAMFAYELSIRRRNVGGLTKEPLPLSEIEARLEYFDDNDVVLITNDDFFAKKAGALLGFDTNFHVGFDTARRLISDDEAHGVQGINAKFYVYERDGLGYYDLPQKPLNMHFGVLDNPTEIVGISSTKIRERLAAEGTGGLGVIVGRFQTPKLEEGHVELISRVLRQHPRTAIVLSNSPAKLGKNDPLSFELREAMLTSAFPSIHVYGLSEYMLDEDWSKALDALVDSFSDGASVTLYGASGTFIDKYSGKYDADELEPIAGLRGVARHDCGPIAMRHTDDFRAGVMYAVQDRYSIGLATADIAIVRTTSTQDYEVACGYKPGERWARIAGGFFDPKLDRNLYDTQKRECEEETGYVADPESIEYVDNVVIDDWRYPGPDRVITTLAMTMYDGEQTLQAGDDFDQERGMVWIPLLELEEKLISFHKPLANKLITYIARHH